MKTKQKKNIYDDISDKKNYGKRFGHIDLSANLSWLHSFNVRSLMSLINRNARFLQKEKISRKALQEKV